MPPRCNDRVAPNESSPRRWGGETLLHAAARDNEPRTVSSLLREGASVTAIDSEGRTPLDVAAELGNLAVVETILHHLVGDETVNLDEYKGEALILASANGHHRVVVSLQLAGVDLNYRRQDWETAFLAAAKGCHLLVVNVLLAAGADADATDAAGLSVLDYAIEGLWRDVAPKDVCNEIVSNILHYADFDVIRWCPCLCEKTPIVVQKHIVAMRTLGMPVDETKFRNVLENPPMQYFRISCETEVVEMMRTFCGKTTVSLANVLTQDPRSVGIIYDEPEALTWEVYYKLFPIYRRALNIAFAEALEFRTSQLEELD